MEENGEVIQRKKPRLEVKEIVTAVAIRKALKNDAVLRGIVRNFKSVEALKKFRSLNRKCFEVGTNALLDSEKGCEHLEGELQLNPPMTGEQKEYFICHGSEARRASLNFGAVTKGSVEEIRKIIFDGLKKLDVLTLRFTSLKLENWLNNPSVLIQETGSLPSLRSVHLPSIIDGDSNDAVWNLKYAWMPQFVRKLISVAGNLEEVHNVDQSVLKVIIDSNRTDVVKSLCLMDRWYRNDNGDREIVAFANSSPRLIRLLTHELNILNPNVKAIVEASKETLRKIQIRYHRFWGMHAERVQEFPVLPMISSADFFTVIKLHQYMGAKQFGLSFPNLDKVRVNDLGWRSFQGYPVRREFPTVRSVFVDFDPGNNASNFMNRLMEMFPSVKSVTLNWQELSKNWTTNAKVWNQIPKQVRRICLYNFKLEKYDNYGLDRLLTGVPKTVCRDLQKLKKDAIDFDRFRTKPSILSLENLKSLKLYVAGDFKLGDVRTKNYLSQLSGWGALDHLPDFKLKFVLPEDLVRDGNLNEVKRLLQPVAQVSSVSFYKRKRQL